MSHYTYGLQDSGISVRIETTAPHIDPSSWVVIDDAAAAIIRELTKETS